MKWLGRAYGEVVDLLGQLTVVVPPVTVAAVDPSAISWRTGILLASLVGLCASLTVSRHRPLIAALIAAPALIAVQRWGLPPSVTNAVNPGALVVVIVVAVRLGATPLWSCAAGAGALFAGLQFDQTWNPLSIMLTVGPCAVGMVLASQMRLAGRLAEQAEEISRERSRFTDEAIRYERARIAADLHDIVAHCVSLIVVQAGAGQRMPGDLAAELDTFDNIASAVSQAQNEINLLVELLAATPAHATRDPGGYGLVRELVERARATGMSVGLQISGDDDLQSSSGDLIYRVVQEGLTNALKHAPGSAVRIRVDRSDEATTVEVSNARAAAPTDWPSLHGAGGGFGLKGLTERVNGVGGRLTHGPTADGWILQAVLPVVSSRT